MENDDENKVDYTKVDFSKDPAIIAFNNPGAESAVETLLSPLKQRLYQRALETGGYTKDKVIELDGKKYKLNLTEEELKYLVPSVYLHSVRIKGSYKKGTVFTRLFRGMDLKKAITQCHFSRKRMATDVGKMLEKGVEHAKQLKLNPEDLYISQIWVGKEPYLMKRVDFKGRGRSGIMEHPHIHIKAILQTKQHREELLQAKKERNLNKKVWEQHHSTPIKVYRGSSQYQW